ncbi:hypothetical protein [Chryseobacterium sp.]|uniref:hypothetical protein n=1 Tax=Chryseobacterium sp. TaxID=1871047 RepID=UPI0028A14A2A|nr:hypothetical protein [Chryseobacterium sp.]
MKKLFYILTSIIFIGCSKDETPDYDGKYFFSKNISKENGVITMESNWENTCYGKSNYIVNENSKYTTYESWIPKGNSCNLSNTQTFTFDSNSKKIDGQPVTFEGNLLILKWEYTHENKVIENIYYYKKN